MRLGPGRQFEIVGRENELELIDRFVREPFPQALLLSGTAGIGKTTVWEAALGVAGGHGTRVLEARTSETEVSLSFSALRDLLEEAAPDLVDRLPAPQRAALEAVLATGEEVAANSPRLAINSSLLNVLRMLVERGPILVAIDDAQWLDPASAGALTFACRRMRGLAFKLLLAARSDQWLAWEGALAPLGLERRELEPLSFGAIRHLVSLQLGVSLPRRALRRVFELSQGNPLVAIELARLVANRGEDYLGGELPPLDVAAEPFAARFLSLPDSARAALLAAALAPHASVAEISSVAGEAAIDEALAAGVLVHDRDRLRPLHPLLATAARKQASARRIQELHLALADVARDDLRRALHLALATPAPDAARAQAVAQVSASAAARGVLHDACELAEHALRLTPADAPEHVFRLLDLGRYLLSVGEIDRMRELLEPKVSSLPAGAPRASAYLMLGEAAEIDVHERYLEQAAAESANDPEVRAGALAMRALIQCVIRVARIEQAEAWALEAASLDAQNPRVLHAVAWARALRGEPVEWQAGDQLELGSHVYFGAVQRAAAAQQAFRGCVEPARAVFAQLLGAAEERGEALACALLHLHLCETALRSGDAASIPGLLREWEEWDDGEQMVMHRERCRALLAALTGEHDQVARAAAAAVEQGPGDTWNRLEARRALGLDALLHADTRRAADVLITLWQHTEREGVLDPGVFPVAADLVEALCEEGSVEKARSVASSLHARAVALAHPWGLATAVRCDALITLAGSYQEAAAAALVAAAERYSELGLEFDRARSLLSLGRAQRRSRKWKAARDTLGQAVEVFSRLGCAGWAERARSELSRVGARRPAAVGALTEAEERVARLALEGLSNKRIAAELFVSVHTVEVHLSRAYAKLGISSRRQLATRLASPTHATAIDKQ